MESQETEKSSHLDDMHDCPGLSEGQDYYVDENGRLVFTAAYLRRRGFCCQSGCLHCPYESPESPLT